MKHTTGR